jgi:hypothetical protein
MTRPIRSYAAIATATLTMPLVFQEGVERFAPFTDRAYRMVNSVAFSPDDQVVYAALFYRDVLALRGRPDSTAAELGLFMSRREGTGWTAPELLSFSGRWVDYEPALSPDGQVMIFNSKRPYPDGRIPERNDLWVVSKSGDGWGQPRTLTGINSFELEESYATIDREQRFVFVRGPVRAGGDDYDLFESRLLPDGSTAAPRRLPFTGERFGEGDPQLAPDGSFLIFTRWDHVAGWQQTCDLYVAFRQGDGWSEPVAATEVNTAQPDYAAALSSDGRWLYYRAGGGLVRRPLAPVIAAARARAANRE